MKENHFRNKFPHLIKAGAAKSLFKPEEGGEESPADKEPAGKEPATVNGLGDEEETPTNARLLALPEVS